MVNPPQPPPDTELGHAMRVMDGQPNLRYAAGLGWFRWNGACWLPGAESELVAAVQSAAMRHASMWPGPFARDLCSRQGLDDVAKICRDVAGVPSSALDQCQGRLHTAGLTWDLQTGDAWPTDQSELNTRATTVEPAAHCPNWLNFLETCFPDAPEMPGYLQRLIGCGITGLGREQVFILMHGGGANGKSTFIDALTHAFKPYVEHLPIHVLMASKKEMTGEEPAPQLLKLRGARLVFTSESDREGRLNESMVKQLTGTDHISARALYSDPVTFQPQAMIFMATNHLPQVRGTDQGIWRRVKVVEWRESFLGERANKNIFNELKAEAAGIIDWALDGAMQWHQSGLLEPDRVGLSTKAYQLESDALTHFFPAKVEAGPNDFISRADLVELWISHNQDEGVEPRDAWKSETVFRALRERGVAETKMNGTRGFRLRRTQGSPGACP